LLTLTVNMHGWILLVLCAITANAQNLVTFGIGLSSNQLYTDEVRDSFHEDSFE